MNKKGGVGGGGMPVSSRLRPSSEKYSSDMFFLGGTMYNISIIKKNVKARIIFWRVANTKLRRNKLSCVV